MQCSECGILADQLAIAREELEKVRDRVVSQFGAASSDPSAMRSLAVAERTLESCIAAMERHRQSAHRAGSSLAIAR